MKIYKRFDTAKQNSNGRPILKIGSFEGNLFLVFDENASTVEIELTTISLIAQNGGYAGSVTLYHLNRLGNANHAIAKEPSIYSAFAENMH